MMTRQVIDRRFYARNSGYYRNDKWDWYIADRDRNDRNVTHVAAEKADVWIPDDANYVPEAVARRIEEALYGQA